MNECDSDKQSYLRTHNSHEQHPYNVTHEV